MTVRWIADVVGGTVEGDESLPLEGLAPVDRAGPRDLTFAVDRRRAGLLARSRAGAAMVPEDAEVSGMALIRVADVDAAVCTLLAELTPPEDLPPAGVHASAVVSADATVADDAAIGPHAVVGARAEIGSGCVLCANVTVEADVVLGADTVLFPGVVIHRGCRLGERVRVGSNSVIGFQGFGYRPVGDSLQRVPHAGGVRIEDDVEIGACTCVDRAKFGETRIGAGTKIDNLVQVAHNVDIGKNCILAGQSGVAGSARLGDRVMLLGSAGVRDNVTLGDGAIGMAFAAIGGDIPAGQAVLGIPARPVRETRRVFKATAMLPELVRRVKALETRLKVVESSDDH
jgi:UDP-3-O-[3-hydroxymyristoyl] glucosamine N-acyltransferase